VNPAFKRAAPNGTQLAYQPTINTQTRRRRCEYWM
jgi:hypothetical protein